MLLIMFYPKHIALIPDGNRTRAKEKGKAWIEGHFEGFERATEIAVYLFSQTPVEVFTLRGLSTENLQNRSEAELAYLFELYKKVTEELYEIMREHQVNFRVTGDRSQLPSDLVDFLEKKEQEFRFNTGKTLVLAINYGGQDEIIRAARKLQLENKEINKENLEAAMDFWGLPTVDLVIRTKQKLAKRLSGFMLWWIGYAQLYFTDLYCPDFTVEELKKAIERRDSSKETQNFGK